MNVKFNGGGTLIFPNTFVDQTQLNVEFNGGGILIFRNTCVDLPNGVQSCNNIWLGMGPFMLQCLGKAQALRVYL